MSRSADSTHAKFDGEATSAATSVESTASSPDFSCEVIMTDRNLRAFTALRYFIERMRDPADDATEVVVFDQLSNCRVVPLAMGRGTVRVPEKPDVGYDIVDGQISLTSAHKRFLYDFVYDAMDSYAEIEDPREYASN
jgi:hypothetical protein